ncbi:uncharacterized protein LOC130501222 [Raphanus sativus]|uniref:Uncharacterized protein LOC130501222 n=1 Tax=Raphanus sativus TaxID=3726 RepID=A0A9W3CKT6_RAPSA|nr:uncharacterized protein LOC130501222 [Raphanus sativus]
MEDSKKRRLEEETDAILTKRPKADAGVHCEADVRMLDTRSHLTMLFMGPSGSGKSTIVGQILLLLGLVSIEELQENEALAIADDRQGRQLAYIIDNKEDDHRLNDEMQLGNASFEIKSRTFTVLDAPGQSRLVPKMIKGAYEADLGILVISASDGEFEQCFSSLTQEHLQLTSAFGVEKLIVLINKMDTVLWSTARFEEIEEKLSSFLFLKNYFHSENVTFLPVSGLHGDNIEMCRSGTVRSLFDVLEAMDLVPRGDASAPFRMPIIQVYTNEDGNHVIYGRVCSGTIKKHDYKHDNLVIMPYQERPKVVALYCIKGKIEVDQAGPGDYVSIHIVPPHNDIHPGAVLSSGGALSRTKSFTAELRFLKTPARMYNGFKAMLHIHSLEVHNCEIVEMKKFTNGSWSGRRRFVKEGEFALCRIEVPEDYISIEEIANFPQLGELVLRTEGYTVAVGNVISWDQDEDVVMAGF